MKIIGDLNELHNQTVNLNQTFLYRVFDNHTEEAGRSLFHSRGQRRERRRPAYIDDFMEYDTNCSIYVYMFLFMYLYSISTVSYMFSVFFFNNELIP